MTGYYFPVPFYQTTTTENPETLLKTNIPFGIRESQRRVIG